MTHSFLLQIMATTLSLASLPALRSLSFRLKSSHGSFGLKMQGHIVRALEKCEPPSALEQVSFSAGAEWQKLGNGDWKYLDKIGGLSFLIDL